MRFSIAWISFVPLYSELNLLFPLDGRGDFLLEPEWYHRIASPWD